MNRREALKSMALIATPLSAVTGKELLTKSKEYKRLVINDQDVGYWFECSKWYSAEFCQCNDLNHQQYHRTILKRSGVVHLDQVIENGSSQFIGTYMVCENKSKRGHSIWINECIKDCFRRHRWNNDPWGEWTLLNFLLTQFHIGTFA